MRTMLGRRSHHDHPDHPLANISLFQACTPAELDTIVSVTIGPGEFFGEMALLDGGPRLATLTTTTAARLLVLTRPEFVALLERAPTVCHRLLVRVGHRLRQARHPSGPPIGT